MASNPPCPVNPINVRGTVLLAGESRERYREKIARITLDAMVQFVGLLDADGTVLEINHVALDAVGIALSDVAGKPFWTTFWWQVSEEINTVLRQSIARAAQGEFVRWDTEIYGRAGGSETIIIDASLCPVIDEQGQVVFICAEGRDITEKKAYEREIARQREELAELDKLKTQFFANISHEFRTPLTLMMGPLEDALACSEGLSEANRQRLELAHRNALRQLKLVNSLLDFSRIEAGRIEASYAPTDLPALTAELASVFRSAIERAGVRLVVDCPPLPEPVYVDREMWEKIVLNLLSNAFKFTFEGEIEVALRPVEGAVQFFVRDTGTGIPDEERPHLFERFHRVKGARGRSFEGSGIGLALVQELVNLHGGTITVASESGQGSTFMVNLPLGSAHLPGERLEAGRTLASTGLRTDAVLEEMLRWLPDEQRHAPEVAPISSPNSPTVPKVKSPRGQRIVLADDNADMRGYVARLLGDYQVEAVADGEAALRAVRASLPALVLADVMMPRMDGFELLRELRADPTTREVPVILLSARAGEESRIEGLEAGADDYLIKPFSARELLARVQAHLQLALVRREGQEALRQSEERLTQELAATTRLHALSTRLLSAENVTTALEDILENAIETCGAAMGNIQLYNPEAGILEIAAQRGFRQEFLDYFREVRVDEGSACAQALSSGERIVIKDVDQDPSFAPHREIAASAGYRAVQSTPLRTHDGRIVGMLSTHFRNPHHVPERDQRHLDLYARHAADLIERFRYEQALQDADRRKDEFLATLAHELRNPLAPIRNCLRLMKLAEGNPQTIERSRVVMERQLAQLIRLVDDLLDLSRITRGTIELRKERVTLAQVIEQAVETSRPLIEENDHELTVSLPPQGIPVEVDLTRLAQVVSNLLNNAARYTERGGSISLTVHRDREQAVVSVRDSGIGIPAPMLKTVFEMFTQVDQSLERSQGGLGIGLTLVKRLVEMHDGSVEARSDGPGQGSEFVVRLPVLED